MGASYQERILSLYDQSVVPLALRYEGKEVFKKTRKSNKVQLLNKEARVDFLNGKSEETQCMIVTYLQNPDSYRQI